MSDKSFIDSVKVAMPCGERWEEMSGNARVRFCTHCAKNVNDLSKMTRKEASRFVRAAGGDICIRYVADPATQRPMFADQLLQITRRAPGIAAGVMTASMTLSSLGIAQDRSVPATDSSIVRAEGKSDDEASNPRSNSLSKITGTITDPNGAVIPNAVITIFSVNGTMSSSSDADGVYKFENLAPGTYRIETTSPGFSRSTRELVVRKDFATSADSRMEVGGIDEVVEVKADIELQVEGQVVLGGVMAVVEYSSALSRAIADDDIDLVRELVIKGADVNAKEMSYSQITPLFVAVEQGNVEIVRLLLDSGAKVNARDSEKQTPLMRLDEDAGAELVELLLKYRAKIDAVDSEGNSPLITAARNANAEVIQALIKAGADIDQANKNGMTALMAAAESDEIEAVRALLIAGAKAAARNKNGDDAWELAYDEDIKELLVSYGATPRYDSSDEDTLDDSQRDEEPR